MTKKEQLLEWINQELAYGQKWDGKSDWMKGYEQGQKNILKKVKAIYFDYK